MALLALLPAALSLVTLGAHFLRGGQWVLLVVCVALLAALALRRRWAAASVQLGLILGAAEWVRTLVLILSQRRAAGEPYLRMVLILGGVAAFTLASAFPFYLPVLRRRFGLRD